MISSITTKIIAPAANARAYGRIYWAWRETKHPKIPATGSNIPESWPQKNAQWHDIPWARRGKETAKPSGKFWKKNFMSIFTAIFSPLQAWNFRLSLSLYKIVQSRVIYIYIDCTIVNSKPCWFFDSRRWLFSGKKRYSVTEFRIWKVR